MRVPVPVANVQPVSVPADRTASAANATIASAVDQRLDVPAVFCYQFVGLFRLTPALAAGLPAARHFVRGKDEQSF